MLRILEGTVTSVPPQGRRKHPHQDFLQIDATKVLFIVGGAFAGLDEIINLRTGRRPSGLSVDTSARKEVTDPFSEVRPEDLHKFGLIPELIGRLLIILTVSPLDRGTLNRILVEPCNALTKQFARFFESDGVQLDFTDEAVGAITGLALERGTGARGLRAILEKLLLDVMFEMPSAEDVTQVVVACKTVLGKT